MAASFDDAAFERELEQLGVGYAPPDGALGRAVIALAVRAGYTAMVLDTSIRRHEAATLYRRLGFVDVPPYDDLPGPLAAWLVFMRLELSSSGLG